jgi:hypothetical protein
LAAEELPEAHIEVPYALESLHPLVRLSESLIRRSVRPRSTIELGKHHCLDIRVGEQNVDRATRIADTLLRALEVKGFAVDITAPETTNPRTTWERPEVVQSKTRVLIKEDYVELFIDTSGPRPPDGRERSFARQQLVRGRYSLLEPSRIPWRLFAPDAGSCAADPNRDRNAVH